MALEMEKRAVGVFSRRSDVELALSELKAANFPMDKVSVVARNAEQEGEIAGVEVQEHTGNKADEGAKVGALAGATLGGLGGLLVGLGMLAIPGIGPIMFAGAEATAIASALAGSAIGAATGSLGGALVGLGIPEDEAKVYSDLVSRGHYLVIVNGTEREINIAQGILNQRNIERWGIYSAPSRDKNAAGLFLNRQNAAQALIDLKEAGYPMNKVSLVTQGMLLDDNLSEVNVVSRDNWTTLGIPDDIAKHYQYRLTLGDYLIVLGGTDSEIAEARNILEANRVKDFHLYSPLVASTDNNNYQPISSRA